MDSNNHTTSPSREEKDTGYSKSNAPSITLPKGGGAMKGIDEKFSVNPTNGTSGMNIPLPFGTTRSGFAPGLSLSYNSGGGNSVFGLGWELSIPSISRKIDKRLPKYQDSIESDVFLFSGAEDLVPELDIDKKIKTSRLDNYQITRYMPRIEGLYARIEKIQPLGATYFYWKVIQKDHTTTFFGLRQSSRINDPDNEYKIYKWLPDLSYDDKGNVQIYEYKSENMDNVPKNVEEQHRHNGLQSISNRYLKTILYGNQKPYYETTTSAFFPDIEMIKKNVVSFFYTTVFDFGEHHNSLPTPAEARMWTCRKDAFSQYHAGFEIRTYRLCRRMLFFSNFKELGTTPYLTHSIDLWYQSQNSNMPLIETDYILKIQHKTYRKNTDGTSYDSQSLPPTVLQYATPQWHTEIKNMDTESLINAPIGLSSPYQWIDYYGEGICGILSEQAEGWYYKSNLGNGQMAPAKKIGNIPSLRGLQNGIVQLQDLEADGKKYAVCNSKNLQGFFEMDDEGKWSDFVAFKNRTNLNLNDPNIRWIDLTGDGMPDLLMTAENVLVWYEADGKKGYKPSQTATKRIDENKGPAIVFSDSAQRIYLADMSGDGLSDIVRIQNGSVCYWPNLGYGRFGAMVRMSYAPTFDHPESFHPTYIHLADISGTGASDLIYVGQGLCKAWLNLSGNGWSDPKEINTLPDTSATTTISIIDLLGNGTSCIVWSSPLPAHRQAPMRYIDLMGGQKPYLMTHYSNSAGKEVSIEYKSSVAYYLEDQKKGTPWLTKLPFPVHCVASQTVKDLVTNTEYSSYYTYHHGYYDHEEREFRGFGRVDTIDSEAIAMSTNGLGNINEPPVYTKTWYHTGAWLQHSRLQEGYRKEYFRPEQYNGNTFTEKDLSQNPIPSTWTPIEQRQAYRALKGSPLRSEIYALDGTSLEPLPYQTTAYQYEILMIQARALESENKDYYSGYAVYRVQETQSMTYQYERNAADPRIAQNLQIERDLYGNILQSAAIVYPRLVIPSSTPAQVASAQQKTIIIYQLHDYTNDVNVPNGAYRLRVGWKSASYELTGASKSQTYFTAAELQSQFRTAVEIDYSATATKGLQKRCIESQYALFLKDDTTLPLAEGVIESKAIPYQQYRLALTQDLFQKAYNGTMLYTALPTTLTSRGKYVEKIDRNKRQYWIPSGTISYGNSPSTTFYVPLVMTDPFGASTLLTYYSDYYLMLQRTQDALGNITEVTSFDFRILQPVELKDANDNLTQMAYDILGMPIALAIKGKGTQGDQLLGVAPDLSATQKSDFFGDPQRYAASLLGNATARYIYDYESTPLRVASIHREEHLAVNPNNQNRQIAIEYSDGLGRLLMKKALVEPGDAKAIVNGQLTTTSTTNRWVGTGRTILNNKSKPIRQYEPYFSTTSQYETEPQLVEIGYSPTLYYDPMGRVIRTDMPDGTYSYTTFDSWEQSLYDPNDTVANSLWAIERSAGGALASIPEEVDAKNKALLHAGTHTTLYTDTLSRPIYTRQRLSASTGGTGGGSINTYTALDVEGNPTAIVDPLGRTQHTYLYDMLGHQIYQYSTDTGKSWMLNDVFGKPMLSQKTDLQNLQILNYNFSYDILHRPTETYINSMLVNKAVYGEGQPNDKVLNLRGQLCETYDASGYSRINGYDFKGNALESRTQLLKDGTQTYIDWRISQILSTEIFTSKSQFDALNRPTTQTDPAGNITLYEYSQSGALKAVWLNDALTKQRRNYVKDTIHNAKGQREAIWYGNGTKTSYTYHPKNYRVLRILTVNLTTNEILQDQKYYYDPVGNITTVRDDAQQTVFFANAMIPPKQEYTYDALYRLIEAKGREKIGLATMGTEDNSTDAPWMGEVVPSANGKALQNYTQSYTYDAANNMTLLEHRANSGSYTRTYTYATTNNQLLNTKVSGLTYTYTYDGYGATKSMPHLRSMAWNLQQQLVQIQRGLENTYYQYSGGQRSRKYTQKISGITEERIYLGNYEIYRKFAFSSLTLERKTVHVSDATGRIAMLEQRTLGTDPAPKELIRFIYSNSIQSANLELDLTGKIISYEEYHPFGTTSYQATNASINAVAKRYRYTGKERDEESGLYYHGARYYIPWLCRWTQPDPIGIKDGLNVYAYVSNNPVMMHDPQGTQAQGREEKPESGSSETEQKVKPKEWKDKVGHTFVIKILDEKGSADDYPDGTHVDYPGRLDSDGVTYRKDDLSLANPYVNRNELIAGEEVVKEPDAGMGRFITTFTFSKIGGGSFNNDNFTLSSVSQVFELPTQSQTGSSTTVTPVMGIVNSIPLNIRFQLNTATNRGNTFLNPTTANAQITNISNTLNSLGLRGADTNLTISTSFLRTTIPNSYPNATSLLNARFATVQASFAANGINLTNYTPRFRNTVSMSLSIPPVNVIIGWNVTTTNFQQSLNNGKPVGTPSITRNSTTFTPNPLGSGTVAPSPSPLTWTGIINTPFVVPQNLIQPYPTRLK